ncbi:MAG TPA: response regulator [Vicinamibacterales bacterium]
MWPTLLTADYQARATGPQVRVLVADDSDQLLGLIAEWLEDEGYVTITATSGRRALDAALVQPPDVALLDLVMPPPDGASVCDALRRQPNPPEIILMTGLSDPERLHTASERDIVAMLRKPLTHEDVVHAVRHAIDRRALAALRRH